MAIRDWFSRTPTTTVVMNVSTAEYIAGEKYKLDPELAAVWIAKGYASGEPARVIDGDELADLTALDQRTDV